MREGGGKGVFLPFDVAMRKGRKPLNEEAPIAKAIKNVVARKKKEVFKAKHEIPRIFMVENYQMLNKMNGEKKLWILSSW